MFCQLDMLLLLTLPHINGRRIKLLEFVQDLIIPLRASSTELSIGFNCWQCQRTKLYVWERKQKQNPFCTLFNRPKYKYFYNKLFKFTGILAVNMVCNREFDTCKLNTISFVCFSWVDQYPLHSAAYEGNADKVRHLLSMGYPADQPDMHSWVPLHYASW